MKWIKQFGRTVRNKVAGASENSSKQSWLFQRQCRTTLGKLPNHSTAERVSSSVLLQNLHHPSSKPSWMDLLGTLLPFLGLYEYLHTYFTVSQILQQWVAV